MWPLRWAAEDVAASNDFIRMWLPERGVKFFPVVHRVERELHEPGNSVPRFHMVWGTGHGLILALLASLAKHPRRSKLSVYFNHRVTDLIQTNGRFNNCGGIDERTGEEFTVTGDCVAIAAGGIAGNLEMVRRYWDKNLGEPPEVNLGRFPLGQKLRFIGRAIKRHVLG